MRHGRTSTLVVAFACTLTGVAIGASWTRPAHAAQGLDSVQMAGSIEQPMFFDRQTGDVWIHERFRRPDEVVHLVVSDRGRTLTEVATGK